MNSLRERTRDFALRIIQLYVALPKSTEAQVLGKQVLRSGTSVGAQYREATRGKSTPDFISKMEGGIQELDETDYWLELLGESGIFDKQRLTSIQTETNELLSIFVASVKTAKKRTETGQKKSTRICSECRKSAEAPPNWPEDKEFLCSSCRRL